MFLKTIKLFVDIINLFLYKNKITIRINTMFLDFKLNWTQVPAIKSSYNALPNKAGVYNFLKVQRINNIPLSAKSYYVGKSLNIRKRYSDHLDPWRSHNKNLFDIMNNKKTKNEIEFWFSELPENQITRIEKILIKNLNPEFNIIYKGKENGK